MFQQFTAKCDSRLCAGLETAVSAACLCIHQQDCAKTTRPIFMKYLEGAACAEK